jgi:RNA polymerase sigma-70 factor (ECF subfamily)
LSDNIGVPPNMAALARRIEDLRPRLHRYCARMTGSAIDGEDVLQDAIVKTLEAVPRMTEIVNLEAFLLRVAHNCALDFLRARGRHTIIANEEALEMIADPAPNPEERLAATASLRNFMALSPAERGSVILMDVLGYSLNEVAVVLEATLPAIKANLHRGRSTLREIANDDRPRSAPVLDAADRQMLASYIERFNARDFDAIRNLLADDVRLDLVARSQAQGRRDVGMYFSRYESIQDWRLAPGLLDGRPAALVSHPLEGPYAVLIGWRHGQIVELRDFRYARYVMETAEIITL